MTDGVLGLLLIVLLLASVLADPLIRLHYRDMRRLVREERERPEDDGRRSDQP